MTKSILASLLTLAALAPAASFAADGTITFTGAVTAQTCTINGGAPNFTTTLPKVSQSVLNADGNVAGATNFSIKLTACTPASGTARVFFEAGPNVDTTTGRLKNTGVSNVQIGLSNTDGSLIKAGAPSATQGGTFATIAADGSATLTYVAQYVATGGAAGTGAVSTSVTYSIEYQ